MQQLSAITKTLILTGFSALSLWTSAAQAASFRGLGLRSAGLVSADGSVIVFSDSSVVNGYEVFRWTESGGIVGLGGFLDSDVHSFAGGVSADGSVIVGWDESLTKWGEFSWAFRWTESGGIVDLGDFLHSDFDNSAAFDVSADGSVIVGHRGYEGFRWTETGGMVGLGDLPGGNFFSPAWGVSADGSVIVGYSSSVNGNEAFRWTESGGIVGLGFLPGDGFSFHSYANSVSADGSVIVGYGSSVNRNEGFRWTESGGMVGLGGIPGGFDNYPSDVSADGSVIVGASDSVNGTEAFRWTEETGMVSLKETLIGAGLDVSGWSLTSANAILADGFTIVGNGINPSGQSEAWVANLSPEPIPEPLTILGSMAAIGFAAGFERKFNKNQSDEKDPDA